MNAADIQRIKDLLPTTLGSEEIRETYASQILRRSLLSARMAYVTYLERLRDVLTAYTAGDMNLADCRNRLLDTLQDMGHSPMDGGGLRNPASLRRLDLILKTNREMASSVARMQDEDEDSVYASPAWELTRTLGRRIQRQDWAERWASAGESVGWDGAAPHAGDFPNWRMIALKSSPIWQALGNGAGGYRDTLGNPYPPFAWGSGLMWMDVDRDECIDLGLISKDTPAKDCMPPKIDMGPSPDEIADASSRSGFDVAEGLE